MKRFTLEVIGSKHPNKEVDADYVSNHEGSYIFRKKLDDEPDKVIARYPVNRTIISSIVKLDNEFKNNWV